jgi:small-conductance mechanosensitive channel
MPETAEQRSKQPDVRKELERSGGAKKSEEKVKAPAKDKFWFVTDGLLLIGCAVLYWLIGSNFIPLIQSEVDLSRRFIRGAALIILALATASLAVQTPAKSFIAWIFILVRQPFRVGDRTKIDDATGDLIDVGYLDTTLWKFGGQYLSTDHPSGRVIRFPKEKVMQKVTEEELGEEMLKRVEVLRQLLAKTPVDELEVQERPRVIFRVSENSWLEAPD